MDEPLLTKNVEASRAFISALHGFGFRVAIDRFGAGPSSLRLLGELDLDAIRLDSSFFSGENNSRRGRHLLEALLHLAAQMRIRTVATGVDSQKQVGFLQQAACSAIQGHSYFKPMPPERFETDVYSDTKSTSYRQLKTVIYTFYHIDNQELNLLETKVKHTIR